MLAFIDRPFAALAAGGGPSKDELKLIFSMFISYPLAGILKRLPDVEPWKKNLFIISASLFFCTGIFSLWTGFLTLVGTAMATYLVAAYVEGPYMPWITFIGLMGHMLYLHAYRELYPKPGEVDITGAQMVLVMKLTAFAWSIFDGRLPEEELSAHQKNRAIRKMPSILDYLGYVLFFPSLFAGPAFDYAEYQRWIDCSMFDVVVPSNKSSTSTKRKRKIPSSWKPASVKAFWAIFWFIATVKFRSWFYIDYMLGDEFLKLGPLARIGYLYAFAFTSRLRYYGAWSLTEGACILTGLGYNGVDPVTNKLKWNRLTNIDAVQLETAENARAYLDAWNMNTNQWLKNYVYLRITPKGKKPGFRSTFGTFVTSAIWHGISPGYYLTFILGAFIQTIAKYFRRYVRPLFLEPDGVTPGPYKRIYDIIGIIVTQITFSYATAPFVILDLKDSLIVWARNKFFIHISIFVLYAYFHSPYGRVYLSKIQKKRVARYQASQGKKKAEEAGVGGWDGEERLALPSATLGESGLKERLAAMNVSRTSINDQPGPLGIPEDMERDVIEAVRQEIDEMKAKKQAEANAPGKSLSSSEGLRNRKM